MSVVNKMLQDLETRKKSAGVSADYVPTEPNLFKPWMLALSVCVISGAILLSQVEWQSEPKLHLYAQQLPPPNFINVEQAKPSASVQPSTSAMAQPQPSAASPEIADQLPITVADEDAQVIGMTTSEENEHAAVPAQTLSRATPATPKNPTADASFGSTAVAPTIKSQAPAQVQQAAMKTAQTNSAQTNIPSEPTGEFSVAPSNGVKVAISWLREQARIALGNDNIKGAIKALDTLITNYPDDIRARKQLASLLFSHQGVERAYQVLTEGLMLSPADNDMRVMLARVAFKTGNYKDAHNVLAAYPYPNLANVELISFRAALAERLSQYENANEDYQMLVSREPSNAKWWLGLGVSQDKLKYRQQALESYRQAKALKQLPTQVNTFVEQRIAALARES